MRLLLYTRARCSHCARAKELLDGLDLAYDEQPLEGRRELERRLQALFGRATMPYVLLDGEPLGGWPELERRARAGELG